MVKITRKGYEDALNLEDNSKNEEQDHKRIISDYQELVFPSASAIDVLKAGLTKAKARIIQQKAVTQQLKGARRAWEAAQDLCETIRTVHVEHYDSIKNESERFLKELRSTMEAIADLEKEFTDSLASCLSNNHKH